MKKIENKLVIKRTLREILIEKLNRSKKAVHKGVLEDYGRSVTGIMGCTIARRLREMAESGEIKAIYIQNKIGRREVHYFIKK